MASGGSGNAEGIGTARPRREVAEQTSANAVGLRPGEIPRCPACGDAKVLGTRTIPDHEYGLAYLARYARCGGCGTVYQVPMPSVGELSDFYPANYHSMDDGGFLLQMRHQMRIQRLRSQLVGGGGIVLDYGCGNGSFLLRAAKQLPGTTFIGFEIGDRSETVTLADGAVRLVKGDIADLLEVLPSCNVIIMNHVIEHLPDPFAIVSTLYPRLVPGGIFDGQTPNVASLEHRIFGRLWSGYHAPRHTVVFSIAGLRRLLERVGFGEISIKGAFNPAGIAVSLASLPHGTSSAGLIPRHGLGWHLYVGIATLLMPLDLLSFASGMVNFCARKGIVRP